MASRCGSLLPPLSADVRTSDDVIAFEGRAMNESPTKADGVIREEIRSLLPGEHARMRTNPNAGLMLMLPWCCERMNECILATT